MNSLVGYTGFVGSNILKYGDFQGLYNSKNIQEAFNTRPELLVYSGVKAEKFLANNAPTEDYNTITQAYENIKKINPKKLVLISTIDVYKNPVDVDEDSEIDIKGLQPYGLNRYYLEQMVEDNILDYLIVRLPGLYGDNLKKNFIFDLINIIPSMIRKEKFEHLIVRNDFIKEYYVNQNNGFYKCKELILEDKKKLKAYFQNIGFSALDFTDSRGKFQFYNLGFLWKHINIALENNIKKLNLATEPIIINELYRSIKQNDFINEVADNVPAYNFKTKHSVLFKGQDGYIFDKDFVLEDIGEYINECIRG